MAIGTDAAIWFFGTQDEVTAGTPATIATGAFGKADQNSSVNWTNDDDAEFAAAVLKCQFDTTMPTTGSIGLLAHCLNVQSTNEPSVPDANYPHIQVGTFAIDFAAGADTDFYTVIPLLVIPQVYTSQAIDWYLHNQNTSQTIGQSWQLWITPMARGPHA